MPLASILTLPSSRPDLYLGSSTSTYDFTSRKISPLIIGAEAHLSPFTRSTMGAQPSRPSEATANQALVERLKALEMKDDRRQQQPQDDYVYVTSDEKRE